MKKIFKLKAKRSIAALLRLAGVIALVAVIGFGFTACGDDNGGGVPVIPVSSLITTVENGEVTIVGHNITRPINNPRRLVIPASINGLPVTTIGNQAFDQSNLISVTISDSVTTIEGGAFSFNELTGVTIGSSVETIGGSAFSFNELTSVTIPDSVRTIGSDAFSDNQIISITIGASVDLPTEAGFSAFRNGFDPAYRGAGRLAGTWTRPDTTSTTWTRQ